MKLNWESFKEKICTDEQIGTFSSEKGIELCIGLDENGKLVKRTLGCRGDVNAVCVGGPGSGKTMFLDQLVSSLTRMYNEDEISLWILDAKGYEFNKYKAEKGVKKLPQVGTILSSRYDEELDPIKAMFVLLEQYVDERYSLFKSLGCKDYEAYREIVREDEKHLPRVIFIADEFIRIFEESADVADYVYDKICRVIKLGRALGVHMIFSGQSTSNNTAFDDILNQCTLRLVLRCQEMVSKKMLDSDIASKIIEKYGKLCTKSMVYPDIVKLDVPVVTDEDVIKHRDFVIKKLKG